MPVVASPAHQGWIKVAPPRRNPHAVKAAQDAAIRSPLAYFACQPAPTKPPSKLPPCPKYDIDEEEHHAHAHKKRGGGGKNRVVSAPASPHGHGRRRSQHNVHYDDEEEDEYDDYDEHNHNHHGAGHRRSPPSRERSRPPPPRTHNRSPPTAAQPRATSAYWTGPSKKHSAPRSYTSSNTGSSRSGGSSVSARWANATAALDLG